MHASNVKKIFLGSTLFFSLIGLNLKTPAFALNETPVTVDTVRDMPAVVLDSEKNVFIAWREHTSDPAKVAVVLQKIDPSGERAWSKEKTLLAPQHMVTDHFALTIDKKNNLYLHWAYRTPGSTLIHYALQKFDRNGEKLWESPLLYAQTFTDNEAYLLGDVSAPKIDPQGNIHVISHKKIFNHTQMLYQIFDQNKNARWSEPRVVAETEQGTESQFYIADLELQPLEKSAYMSFIGVDEGVNDRYFYVVLKVDYQAEIAWTQKFEIPVNEEVAPAFINLPTADEKYNIHLGWALKNTETGYLTQYFKTIKADGTLLDDQSKSTNRLYYEGLRATILEPSTTNSNLYGIAFNNILELYGYKYGDNGQLTEKIISVNPRKNNIFYNINNWSLTSTKNGESYFAWSQHEQAEDGHATNYQIFVQKFTSNLSKTWGNGEKANSKRPSR